MSPEEAAEDANQAFAGSRDAATRRIGDWPFCPKPRSAAVAGPPNAGRLWQRGVIDQKTPSRSASVAPVLPSHGLACFPKKNILRR
jgi:hypothetical protein